MSSISGEQMSKVLSKTASVALWQCFNLQVEGCRTKDQEVEVQEENDTISFCIL